MEAQEEDKHGLDISLTLSQETDTPKTMMEGEHTTFQGKMEKGQVKEGRYIMRLTKRSNDVPP